jgi:hypothetical protein
VGGHHFDSESILQLIGSTQDIFIARDKKCHIPCDRHGQLAYIRLIARLILWLEDPSNSRQRPLFTHDVSGNLSERPRAHPLAITIRLVPASVDLVEEFLSDYQLKELAEPVCEERLRFVVPGIGFVEIEEDVRIDSSPNSSMAPRSIREWERLDLVPPRRKRPLAPSAGLIANGDKAQLRPEAARGKVASAAEANLVAITAPRSNGLEQHARGAAPTVTWIDA